MLERTTLIDYWVVTAKRGYKTMLNLYKSGDYHWSLFMGHLVIEKLLKDIYVKNIDDNPPRIHDLLRLAEMANIHITEEQKDILDLITTFNINARYPDYNQSFYKRCDYNFTTVNIERIKGLIVWPIAIIDQA